MHVFLWCTRAPKVFTRCTKNCASFQILPALGQRRQDTPAGDMVHIHITRQFHFLHRTNSFDFQNRTCDLQPIDIVLFTPALNYDLRASFTESLWQLTNEEALELNEFRVRSRSIGVVLMNVFLTLNIIHTLFWFFY